MKFEIHINPHEAIELKEFLSYYLPTDRNKYPCLHELLEQLKEVSSLLNNIQPRPQYKIVRQ